MTSVRGHRKAFVTRSGKRVSFVAPYRRRPRFTRSKRDATYLQNVARDMERMRLQTEAAIAASEGDVGYMPPETVGVTDYMDSQRALRHRMRMAGR